MTNLDRWMSYTDPLEAHDDFIKMSWYFACSAALERRVWYGDFSRAMFVAQYVLFVGPPGVGKGSSMREGFKMLRKYAARNPDGSKRYRKDDPKELEPLFFSLPDTVIFEQLIQSIADHTFPFVIPGTGDIYAHSSAYFGLEELSSLMRKNKSEDVCRLLLNLYDNVPYRYETKKSGKASLTNGCLNLLAGTQVDFIRRCEKDGILGEGLISRFLIVYCDTKRKTMFEYPPLTPEQLEHQDHLQKWLYRLSSVYGRIQYEDPVADPKWLLEWWQEEYRYLERFIDSKLANYFDRRKDHVMKLAAAIHFSESDSLIITRRAFEEAIRLVRHFELGAIKVAQKAGRNTAFPIQERLVSFIRQRPRTNSEVYRMLESEMDLTEIMNSLALLTAAGRIEQDGDIWRVVKEVLPEQIATSDVQTVPDPETGADAVVID